MLFLELNIGLFFGRFHAVIVHLPIGFLLLGGIFYFLEKKQKEVSFSKSLGYIFFFAAISSVLAVIFGWLLANGGGYAANTLFWHRWLGISTAAITTILWLQLSGQLAGNNSITKWGIIAMIIMLTLTGHFGGQLTHGSSYLLDYAPSFIQNIIGNKQIIVQDEYPQNPDSIFIYDHLLQPIFNKKCISCHNVQDAKGGLALDSKESLIAGGDHGDVLKEKSKHKIELLNRVTLPKEDRKFMPPKGNPMTFYEIKLLEYWIKNGQSFEQVITDKKIPPDIKDLIHQTYGLSDQRKSFVELNSVNSATPEDIELLQNQGFFISALSRKSNFLQVRYSDSITCEKLQLLIKLKTQISWLDLSKTSISNDCIDLLGQLPNLSKLNLSQNAIDNSSLRHLTTLTNLESLNLYQTTIDDAGLKSLEKLQTLSQLYLWETNVSQSGVNQLKEKLSSLNINMGPNQN